MPVGLEPLGSSNPPAVVSTAAGTTGGCTMLRCFFHPITVGPFVIRRDQPDFRIRIKSISREALSPQIGNCRSSCFLRIETNTQGLQDLPRAQRSAEAEIDCNSPGGLPPAQLEHMPELPEQAG